MQPFVCELQDSTKESLLIGSCADNALPARWFMTKMDLSEVYALDRRHLWQRNSFTAQERGRKARMQVCPRSDHSSASVTRRASSDATRLDSVRLVQQRDHAYTL